MAYLKITDGKRKLKTISNLSRRAWWPSDRTSDSGARGRGFDPPGGACWSTVYRCVNRGLQN